MRFLIDGRACTDQQVGGVTKVADRLVKAMIDRGKNESWVLGTTGVGVQQPENNAHLMCRHRSIPNKLVALGTFFHLTSFDRLIPGEFDALFLPNLETVGRPRIPYGLLVHDLSFLIEPRWFSWKSQLWHRITRARELIQRADVLFSVSERTRQDLVHLLNIPAERILTLPLGTTNVSAKDLDELPPELVNVRYLLVLGAKDLRKNIACVEAAFRELVKDSHYQDVKLLVLGKTHRPSDHELAALMRHASVFLYPSWYEGFGLPLHEAAAFHVPLIASTAGALPETAPPGTLFVPPFKPHLWVQAMKSALTEPVQTLTSLADWGEAGQIIIDTLRRIAKNRSRSSDAS